MCQIETRREIKKLCIEGLYTDGEHHKQWYLEQVLVLLGYSLEQLKSREMHEWEEGVQP